MTIVLAGVVGIVSAHLVFRLLRAQMTSWAVVIAVEDDPPPLPPPPVARLRAPEPWPPYRPRWSEAA